MREELQQVLNLLHLPHRGSATPLEAEAFRRLRTLLQRVFHGVSS
ncbi:hypothetical protein [Thermus sp. NMX2.A1]|nr:hypothetical protein [Thermus sp. NMX2.A1]ETN87860.1 hypothetical protein TNMX_10740 [Thermus sp. NMX2.A1]